MKIEVYKDNAGEFRWRKKADNGEVVADSGEGYVNEEDCYERARAELDDGDTLQTVEDA